MSQTRKRSAAESALVTGVALAYAVPINYLFIQHMPLLNPWLRAVLLTAFFTLLGFLLKFGARRFFNWCDERYPVQEGVGEGLPPLVPCPVCGSEAIHAIDVLKRVRIMAEEFPDVCHTSHVTRISDASSFDEVCVNCGARDAAGGGWGTLKYPCKKVPEAAAK